jgi:hypothetical protein
MDKVVLARLTIADFQLATMACNGASQRCHSTITPSMLAVWMD